MRAKQLREKRLKLINDIRAIYAKEDDAAYAWKAEDTAEIQRMEAELKVTEEQLARAESFEGLGTRLASLGSDTRHADQRIGREDFAGENPERDENAPRFEDRAFAFQAWLRSGTDCELTAQQRAACQRLNFNPARRGIRLGIEADNFLSSIANEYRDASPASAKRQIRMLCSERAKEARTMSVFDGSAGGYLVPIDFLNNLQVNMVAFSGMMQVADIIQTASGSELQIPTMDDTSNTGEFVGESSDQDGSTDPNLGQVSMFAFKASSKMVKVPYELLEDNAFNLAGRMGTILGQRLGRIKNTRFTTGTGVKQPRGLLTAATLGVTAASASAITFDEVFDLDASVDPAYGDNGTFMCHKNTAVHLRKKKDSNGQYLWQPSVAAGQPDTINAKQVYYNTAFPQIATTAKVLTYGDHSKYLIRESGVLRLRRFDERYGNVDQVAFIAFQRVDGNLIDAGTAPVKYLQMG